MKTTMQPTVTVQTSESTDAYALVFIGDRSFRRSLAGMETCTIGRASDCDLQIDDASVSRRHARLAFGSGGPTLEDLGSHNGTRVNGIPIEGMAPIGTADVITIGEATILLHLTMRASTGELDAHILARLEAELDRATRYGRRIGLALWHVDGATAGVAPLLAPLMRRCDALGVIREGGLLGIFPELDADAVADLARRGLELIRPVAPTARAGVAAYPLDGGRAPSLLEAVREAVAGAAPVGHADRTVRELPIGDHTILVADRMMARVYDLVRRLAKSDLPVLVTGETGAGKELACRALHEWSPRAGGPFVAVNCAALPVTLIESELFGHQRGAFTGADRDRAGVFEHANGGTLFLDEIGELPPAAQAKLLRAVETRTITRLGSHEPIAVDVRFVAATNRDLEAEVAAGRFRQDLYFRLTAAQVTVPPLRDRPRDIAALARAFVARACTRIGCAPLLVSDATLRTLAARPFPGNVRELANAMEYAVTIAHQEPEEDMIEPWHLPGAAPAPTPTAGDAARFRPIAEEVEELEQRRMNEALVAAGGNQSRAAELIGMPRRTFVTKLSKYGLR